MIKLSLAVAASLLIAVATAPYRAAWSRHVAEMRQPADLTRRIPEPPHGVDKSTWIATLRSMGWRHPLPKDYHDEN